MLAEMVQQISVEERTDPGLLRDKVRDEVRRCLRKRSGRRPLVPVIMEIWWPLPPHPPRQRVPGRGALRRGRALDRRARHLRAERSGVVLQHGRYPRPRELRGSSEHSWRKRRSRCSATYWCRPRSWCSAGTSGAGRWTPSTPRSSASCCSSRASPACSRLPSGRSTSADTPFAPAAGSASSSRDSPAYLNRTGSIIVFLTLLFMSVILATQFSFGRLFAWLMEAAAAAGGDASRRSASGARTAAAKQRREVIAKHAKRPA